MMRRIVYGAAVVSVGLIAVLSWPADPTTVRGPGREDVDTGGAPNGTQAAGPSARRLRTKEAATLALQAIGRAKTEPAPVEVTRSVTDFDRLVIKDRRALNLRGAVMDALDVRDQLIFRQCPAAEELENVTLELTFQVTATAQRAVLRNPSLRVLRGAPVDPNLERCYLALLASLDLEAAPSRTFTNPDFPEYEGQIEIVQSIGDRPRKAHE